MRLCEQLKLAELHFETLQSAAFLLSPERRDLYYFLPSARILVGILRGFISLITRLFGVQHECFSQLNNCVISSVGYMCNHCLWDGNR